jgi:ricin-type beta-trefoil lectin protein
MKSGKTSRSDFFGRVRALARLSAFCLTFAVASANASDPGGGSVNLTSIAAAPNGGFWVQVDAFSNGGGYNRTLAIDGAPQFEDVPYRGSIAAIPHRNGYWVVTPAGMIYPRGDAPSLCNQRLSDCSDFPIDPDAEQSVVSVAATPTGLGFWALTEDGKVFTTGDAISYGDVTKDSANSSAIVATPSGRGYYVLLEDGGVYSFGDAVFYGSTGGKKPGGQDATGLAPSFDATGKINGYWMVAKDGGVFSFGDAPFLGSTGGDDGGSAITNITALPDGHSYAWVHGDGRVDRSRTFPKVAIEFKTRVGWVWGISGHNKSPGLPILLSAADGSTSQQWNLWPTTSDGKIVQIVNVNSGLCADLTQDLQGAFLVQYTCKGKAEDWDNQRFTVIVGEDGRTNFSPVDFSDYRITGGARNGRLLLQQFGGPNYDPNGNWNLLLQSVSSNWSAPWSRCVTRACFLANHNFVQVP